MARGRRKTVAKSFFNRPSDSKFTLVAPNPFKMMLARGTRVRGKDLEDVLQGSYCTRTDPCNSFDLRQGRIGPVQRTFLPIQRHQYPGDPRPRGPNQRNRLPYGGARRDDVVHDQDIALQRSANEDPALAVVLGLFAVVRNAHSTADAVIEKADTSRAKPAPKGAIPPPGALQGPVQE